jgi:LmbE family N-acetylglucosaminyl deacetylase
VEEDIKEIKPEIIYTHHSGDLNIDHRITFRAVLTAVRPAVASTVRELYAFEIPSSTDWAFGSFEPVFRPNTFVDISGELETKLEALSGYSSEVRNFPHPRSLEAVRAKAKSWGSIIGCEAGEAFELIFSLNRKS